MSEINRYEMRPDSGYGSCDAFVELDGEWVRHADHASVVAALQAEREWRPIETAPEDETPFLAYVPGRGIFECSILPSGIGRYYFFRNLHTGGWETFSLPAYPTIWQPLPAPPTTEGGERG